MTLSKVSAFFGLLVVSLNACSKNQSPAPESPSSKATLTLVGVGSVATLKPGDTIRGNCTRGAKVEIAGDLLLVPLTVACSAEGTFTAKLDIKGSSGGRTGPITFALRSPEGPVLVTLTVSAFFDSCALANSDATFGAGDGSAANPYLICTAAQFGNLHSLARSKFFALGRDLDLATASSDAINFENTVFDGRNHILKNFQRSGLSFPGIGLINEAHSSVIRDLTIEDFSISDSTRAAGGLVGAASDSYLLNIGVRSGKISHLGATDFTGAMVGSFCRSQIDRANVEGSVVVSGAGAAPAAALAGGCADAASWALVSNSITAGTVSTVNAVAIAGLLGSVSGPSAWPVLWHSLDNSNLNGLQHGALVGQYKQGDSFDSFFAGRSEVGAHALGSAKGLADLKTQATYAKWSADVWQIEPAKFPELKPSPERNLSFVVIRESPPEAMKKLDTCYRLRATTESLAGASQERPRTTVFQISASQAKLFANPEDCAVGVAELTNLEMPAGRDAVEFFVKLAHDIQPGSAAQVLAIADGYLVRPVILKFGAAAEPAVRELSAAPQLAAIPEPLREPVAQARVVTAPVMTARPLSGDCACVTRDGFVNCRVTGGSCSGASPVTVALKGGTLRRDCTNGAWTAGGSATPEGPGTYRITNGASSATVACGESSSWDNRTCQLQTNFIWDGDRCRSWYACTGYNYYGATVPISNCPSL